MYYYSFEDGKYVEISRQSLDVSRGVLVAYLDLEILSANKGLLVLALGEPVSLQVIEPTTTVEVTPASPTSTSPTSTETTASPVASGTLSPMYTSSYSTSSV